MEIAMLVGVVLFCGFMLAWPVWFKAETRARRRKDPRYTPPHVMGVMDEVFYPSHHQASQVQEVERVLPAPAPTPGDKDLDRGRVVIDLGQNPK